jgi:Zn-dependent protease
VYQLDPFSSPVVSARRRSPHPLRDIAGAVNWEIVAGFVIVIAFFAVVLWLGDARWTIPGTVGLVIAGWIFGVCLHEFGHAATAYLGGDTSDGTISYLSFNPLKYLHPVLSVLLPVLFIVLGGLPLPGGAVYVRRDLVRNRGWQSAISLAGPVMSLLFGVVLALPFLVAKDTFFAHQALVNALALMIFLQIGSVLFNLLPIPPLDGYGVISPWLPRDVQQIASAFLGYGIFLVFALFLFVPALNAAFFDTVFGLVAHLGIDPYSIIFGLQTFDFWQR